MPGILMLGAEVQIPTMPFLQASEHLVLGVQMQVDAKCVVKEHDVNINIAMLDKPSLIAKPE